MFEITTPRKWNIGTTKKPKFHIFDIFGSTIDITAASFRLHRKSDGELVDSGTCAINDADTSPQGETISTIQPTVELSNTDINEGQYWLSFFVTLSNGEDSVLRQLVEVVDNWN